MPKHLITFKFISPWHMGSGFGEGAHLDALPVKSASGLPYIPGRTVKGLFREAVLLAEECGQVPCESTVSLFGSRDDKLSRYESTPGSLSFTSATLGDAMEQWAGETDASGKPIHENVVHQLFMPLAATRIDFNGLAHDKSLRKIEVALPVCLTAQVEYSQNSPDIAKTLQTAARLIRQTGSWRHRGLGRVQVSLTEVQP